MAMAVDQPSEDALADAFLKERDWVSNHTTMSSLWNPLRAQGMITQIEEETLKKFLVQGEQVPKLVDILERKGKLGEFYKLLKENQERVIRQLRPRIDKYEEQRSVSEAVGGQSQINTAEARETQKAKVRTTASAPEGQQGGGSLSSWLVPLGIAIAAALLYKFIISPTAS